MLTIDVLNKQALEIIRIENDVANLRKLTKESGYKITDIIDANKRFYKTMIDELMLPLLYANWLDGVDKIELDIPSGVRNYILYNCIYTRN